MVLIDDNCTENLDQLAQEHFRKLIEPRNLDKSFHKTQSLIGRILEQLENDKFLLNRKLFWKYLLCNNYENLEKIITARPNALADMINDIGCNFRHCLFSNHLNNRTANLTEFGRIVKRVFGYENYRDNGFAVINNAKLNVNYCPYCNQQKTQSITITNGTNGMERTLALNQLDHFYPQSRYPFLGISFFNLIPSCSPCNVQLKGEKDFSIETHFNPFHKRFDDFFKFQLTQIVNSKFEEVQTEFGTVAMHLENNIEDFRLVERYNDNDCKKIAFNLIAAYKNRSSAVKRSYRAQFKGLFATFENTNETLMKSQGIPLNSNQINDFQMGKFKRDICIQLKLI